MRLAAVAPPVHWQSGFAVSPSALGIDVTYWRNLGHEVFLKIYFTSVCLGIYLCMGMCLCLCV